MTTVLQFSGLPPASHKRISKIQRFTIPNSSSSILFKVWKFDPRLMSLNTLEDIKIYICYIVLYFAHLHVMCDSTCTFVPVCSWCVSFNAVNVLCASVGILTSGVPSHQCCWSGGCCYHPRHASSHLQSHAAVPGSTCDWVTHWRCCSTSAATCLSSLQCYLLAEVFLITYNWIMSSFARA